MPGHREGSVPFSYLISNQRPVGYSIDLCMKIVDAVSGEPGKAVAQGATNERAILDQVETLGPDVTVLPCAIVPRACCRREPTVSMPMPPITSFAMV